jgi:ABC-2 type transport system permease protein
MAVTATAFAGRQPLRAADHFRLLIAVRWQSYRNSLRKSSVKRAKFLAAAFTWLIAIIGGLGSALAFVGFGYAAGSKGKSEVLGIGLFAVFLLWQFAPILFEVTSPTINFRDIARYPVTLRTYYLLHLAFGLLDPSVLLSTTWLLSLWIGLLVSRPMWALKAVLPFLAFAAFNLLSNRAVLSLLERIFATRRGRERTLALVMVLAMVAQVAIYGVLPRGGEAAVKHFFRSLLPIWVWSPPGVTTAAISSGPALFAAAIAALIAYSLLAGWILRGRLRANFNGESYSESSRRSGAVQMQSGWSLPLVSERISAIVEKEVRYALRDSRTLLNLATPTVFALIIVLGRGMFARVMSQGMHINISNWQVHPSVASLIFISYLAYNSFGTDASGFARWALSPATSRDVLIGKNVAICMLWTASLVGVNVVLIAGMNLSYWLLLLTLLGVLYGGLAILAAGNQLSVRIPTRFEVGAMTKNLSEGVMFASMLLCAAVGAAIWLVYRLSRLLAAPWITPVGIIALTFITACLYVLSLRNAARYLDRNIEKISAELQ